MKNEEVEEKGNDEEVEEKGKDDDEDDEHFDKADEKNAKKREKHECKVLKRGK